MSWSSYCIDRATHHFAQKSGSNPASTTGTSGVGADFCLIGQVDARTPATHTASKWALT
ncbi:hypothetical protein WJ438_00690 [Streptomyces sp. GD-15H]|uniref:hypothetical protein n=1 Tax=Streptomyces sp. GD-15H TaxID=3129112 RepID=UPI00324C4E21